MEKSKIYKAAQIAVLDDRDIPTKAKLDILRVLMDDEKVALFCEQEEAKKEAEKYA